MRKLPPPRPKPPAGCRICGRPIVQRGGRGRPRLYCSGLCRAVAQGLLTHEDVAGFPQHCSKD